MAFNDEPLDEFKELESKKLANNLEQLSLLVKKKTDRDGLILQSENPTQEEILANKIFNSLGSKIVEIAQDCLTHTKEDEYIKTTKVLINLIEAITKIGGKSISFTNLLEKRELSGGKVSYFKSDIFYIDNVETTMEIRIRPDDEYAQSKGQQVLKAQARTSITLTSSSLPDGEANIRIDPPDRRLDNNVVFDISVGRADQQHKTIIDHLPLHHLGQKAGHHFSSGIRINDFQGITVSDIHKVFRSKLENLSKDTQNSN